MLNNKNIGGMYEILRLVSELLRREKEGTITAAEVQEATDLCRQSISKNLNRLVRLGFLTRIDSHDPIKGYRVVKYELRENAIKFIRDVLYD